MIYFERLKGRAKNTPHIACAFRVLRDVVLVLRLVLFCPPEDWVQFKRASSILARLGHHGLYERWLRRFDRALTLPEVTRRKFLDVRGRGVGNINIHRRARLGGVDVFEKIYNNNSDHLHKVLWFHRDVLPRLVGMVTTPAIVTSLRGEKMTIVYFEYISEQVPVTADQLLPAATRLQLITEHLRVEHGDPTIIDFRRDPFYRRGAVGLRATLERASRDPELQTCVEQWLSGPDVPKRFAHADFVQSNVLSCGAILDFDKCGYYPVGYDFGRTLRVCESQGFDSVDAVESVVREQIAKGCWKTLAGHLYFSAVFRLRSRNTVRSDDVVTLSLFDRTLDLIANEA